MPTSLTTAPQTWLTDPVESGPAAGFGLYLHVPFCHHRCGYCDFATAAVGDQSPDDQQELFDRYLAALVTDLRRQVSGEAGSLPWSDAPTPWPTVTSIFVGGGTPTMLGGRRLATLLGAVREVLDVAAEAEITVECNPETASVELFGHLAQAGARRVSMGAQSFAPHVLKTLERGHDAERPLTAVRQAREAGVDQINLDLIFGTPGETNDDWVRSLQATLAAGIDHVSAYALTIHDNTAFGSAVRSGAMANVDDDVQRDRFDTASQILGSGGFNHYEVSNFSLGSARRSQHNLLYWRHGNYLAVGVGAHGHLDGRRWWTTRSTSRYLDSIEAADSPVAGSEVLTDQERAEERLMLGLRVREGLHPHDVPPIEPMALEDAMKVGLIETSCGRLRCSDSGWFLLDEAVSRLL